MCELKTKNTLNLADAIDSSSKSRFFRLQAKELDQLSLHLKEELLNSHSRPLENSFNQTVPRPDKRLFKLIQWYNLTEATWRITTLVSLISLSSFYLR